MSGWAEEGQRLFQEQRYLEAARTLLRDVPEAVRRGGRPDEGARRALRSAAVAFSRAERPADAAALYVVLDERERAADVLRRAGRRAEAVEVLNGGGVHADPLRSGRRAERPATNPLASARTPEEALVALRTIDPLEPRYPAAARRAVMIGWQHDLLDFDLDHWLSRWLGGAAGAHGPADLQPLYSLGLLYVRKGLPESAEAAFRAVLRLQPGLAEAREQLASILTAREQKDVSALHRILDEDRAFREAADPVESGHDFAALPNLPDLPELPELPSLPSLEAVKPVRPAARRAAPVRRAASPVGRAASRPEAVAPTVDVPAPSAAAPLGTVDPRSLEVGAVIAERYIVDRELGRGGMGVVFRVRDTMLEEDVALKIITKPGESERDVQRFKEEMKICRRLSHPNIVRVFEFGAWRGNHFLTMELLDGDDLEGLIREAKGPVPLLTALPLLLQACDGLGAAHAQGVVHRDVKPPNLFVADGGKTLKVMDFGIAKANRVDASLTATGTLVGSPAYIAPERLVGEEQESASSDLYALGVVIYQLFTGALPFQKKELPALFMQHMNEAPMPPSRRNPRVTPALDAIVLGLLAKAPADRPQSMRALRKALEGAWGELLKTGG